MLRPILKRTEPELKASMCLALQYSFASFAKKEMYLILTFSSTCQFKNSVHCLSFKLATSCLCVNKQGILSITVIGTCLPSQEERGKGYLI